MAELERFSLRQKLFIDFADRHIVSSYGFSQTHRTLLVEERIEAAFNGIEVGDALEVDLVIAPNLRYYDTPRPPRPRLRVLQSAGHQQAALGPRSAGAVLRQ